MPLDKPEFSGDVKWIHSALTSSLAAAAHEDYEIKPAAGRTAVLQAWAFQVTGPAGAGSGNHKLDVYLTDGTNEIMLFDSEVVFGAGMNYRNDSSADTGARPELLDRSLITWLQNIVLTNDIYLIIRYTNDTDVATTRERAVDICYRER